MKKFGPAFLYIALIAFLPLIYLTILNIDTSKITNPTFMILLFKDFLRTLPICAFVFLPIVLYPKLTRPYLVGIQLIFMPLMFLELGHIHLFGTRIGLNTFYTLFVSNILETREFISQNIPIYLIIAFLVFMIVPFYFIFKIPVPERKQGRSYVLFLLLTIALATPFVYNLPRQWPRFKDAYVLNPYSNVAYHYYLYRTKYQALKDEIEKNKTHYFAPIQSVLPEQEKQTYVIVIGESANRNHLSLYGYPRLTNEFTTQIQDELFVFKNVVSPFAQTMPSLERVLTFADEETPDLVHQGSIVDYFNAAGFKTYWLSNQYALDDTIVTAFSHHADYNKYFNFGGMKRFEKAGLDADMLPDFQKIVQKPDLKKVIFVHLIGSHAAYINRYPSEFSHFKSCFEGKKLSWEGCMTLNAYDNSIRYTDFVLRQLIDLLKQESGIRYLLYFSDHGEDIYDSTTDKILGHSQLANEPMTEIPFILWLSDDLKRARPDLPQRAMKSLNHPYNTDDAIHTIIDLSSLQNINFDVRKSILEPMADLL